MDWVTILGKYMDRQPWPGAAPGVQHVGGDVSIHRDFEIVAHKAPRSVLAEALAFAFRSAETAPFGETLGRLFNHATPQQRAQILGALLTIAPGAVRGDLASLFGRNREVSPADAERVSSDLARQVAAEAERRDSGIVDRISDILAGYPKLLKNLEVGALSAAMARIGEIMAGARTMTGGGGQ